MIKHALIALAVTAGLSTAASAQEDAINVLAANANTRTASVNIADLQLTSAAGKSALYSRVKRAAQTVCSFDNQTNGDSACFYDAQRDGSRQASAIIAAAANGRVAASSIVLHGAL